MSAENKNKRCRDCELGEKTRGSIINLSSDRTIPLGVIIPPKIRRNCLNPIDTVLKRRERIVGLAANCVKPKSYLSKE